jgi:hypothetical protein
MPGSGTVAAPKGSLRGLKAGRLDPLLDMDGRLSLPRSADKSIALNPWRGALRLFAQPLRLFFQSQI